ncbi:MAG: hypothetical protein AAGA62_13260, partial [Bacteroidota bacterium]
RLLVVNRRFPENSTSTAKFLIMSKVSKELLQRYFSGDCSATERQLVEAWLSSDQPAPPLALDEKTKATYRDEMWRNIDEETRSNWNARVVPFYKHLLRYAAAACLLIAVFFGGRLSAYTSTDTITDKAPKNHLYIAGGNGARGNLPGDSFRVKFAGTLRLHNGGLMVKAIEVGDSTFTLAPQRTYYLQGSVEEPRLLDRVIYTRGPSNSDVLEGDFSVLNMDNKK